VLHRQIKINFRGGLSHTYTLPRCSGSSEEAEAFVRSVRHFVNLRRQEEMKLKQSEIENAEKQEVDTNNVKQETNSDELCLMKEKLSQFKERYEKRYMSRREVLEEIEKLLK
jgi:hypothetical protein